MAGPSVYRRHSNLYTGNVLRGFYYKGGALYLVHKYWSLLLCAVTQAVQCLGVGNVPLGTGVTYERFQYVAPRNQYLYHFRPVLEFAFHLYTNRIKRTCFRCKRNLMVTYD